VSKPDPCTAETDACGYNAIRYSITLSARNGIAAGSTASGMENSTREGRSAQGG
jgi:hypothetical protein